MNHYQLLALLLVLAAPSYAETFVGLTSATNRFLVATNEAVIITRISSSGPFQIIKDGTIYTTFSGGVVAAELHQNNPVAVAGPAEFIFTNSSVVNFRRLPSTAIQSVFVTATNSLIIPAQRSVRFFAPLGGVLVRPSRGQSVGPEFNISASSNDELTGPLDVQIRTNLGAGIASVVSYVTLEEAQILEQQGVVQGATGRFSIVVEKSLNLTNWFPSSLHETTDDQKAYYRLRITK